MMDVGLCSGSMVRCDPLVAEQADCSSIGLIRQLEWHQEHAMKEQRERQQSQTGNLGQKDARGEKQKEEDLSHMGEKTQQAEKQQQKSNPKAR